MKYLIQFLIIIAFAFVGEVLHFLIPIPVPASIYGIILLIDSWEAIRSSIIQYIAVILLTTVVVMGCAGFVTQYVIRKGKEKKK